ncbi:MAG: chemotaxis protein CheW [Actinobacteria bacterium]|nr:MAG: chemotaxis protein CheW [Actinomycetota bacterium]
MSPAVSDSSEPVPTTGPVSFEIPQVVVFRLDEQLHALPIECVQEIQQIVEFTPVPGGSAALVGMIDLRGSVVPAIDLRALLGMPMIDYSLDTPMIFFRTHGRLVALLVDEVDDVVDLPDDCMQPPSNLYDLADRMIGICKLTQGLVIVLDPDRLVPDAAPSSGDVFGMEDAL